MVAGTVQAGVLNGTPIVARSPPPEGQMAAQLPVTLTPSIFATNGLQQLSSGQMGGMSQVVTLIVDNTQGMVPVTVIHGALNETLVVPSGTAATVPTFSGQGYWPWAISTVTAPAANNNTNMILLNYQRSASTYRATSNTIQNTGENSGVLYSGRISPTGNSTTTLNAAGPTGSNWVVDSLEIAFDDIQNTSAGLVQCLLQFGANSASPIIIETMYALADVTSADLGAVAFCYPCYRTWSQGLLVNTNQPFYVEISAASNMKGADIRVNVSGYNTG